MCSISIQHLFHLVIIMGITYTEDLPGESYYPDHFLALSQSIMGAAVDPYVLGGKTEVQDKCNWQSHHVGPDVFS